MLLDVSFSYDYIMFLIYSEVFATHYKDPLCMKELMHNTKLH